MNGQRALVYSRIRENRLDSGENDLSRAARQQQVIQAVSAKLAGVGTFLDLPFIGGDLMKPLATDLSASDFIQLGWVRFRAGGGGACTADSAATPSRERRPVLRPTEDNRAVISMFTGESAPQPPPGLGDATRRAAWSATRFPTSADSAFVSAFCSSRRFSAAFALSPSDLAPSPLDDSPFRLPP